MKAQQHNRSKSMAAGYKRGTEHQHQQQHQLLSVVIASLTAKLEQHKKFFVNETQRKYDYVCQSSHLIIIVVSGDQIQWLELEACGIWRLSGSKHLADKLIFVFPAHRT